MLRYEIGRECRNLSHLFASRRLANQACAGGSDFVGIELEPTYGDFGQAALGREFRDRTQVRYRGLILYVRLNYLSLLSRVADHISTGV
jgi:hypothetical protein